MAMSDWSSGLKLARDEGIEEGILRTAKNLLRKGFDVSVIADVTGLDESTISKLRLELLQ
jgi:predicted transposase/invertase (TIGR01784 family)